MLLRQRIKTALDEARMVVLVVQVLVGFQFRVVLEPRFDRLPPVAQAVHVVGLGCLLAAFALAVWPATFHRIAEHGNDTPRVLQFTSRMVGLALLPFAAALGASLFEVGAVTGTLTAATAAAAIGIVTAVSLWYGWPMLHRRPPAPLDDTGGAATEVSVKIDHILTEARMVLPGAQALLGFQFLAFFADGFTALPPASRTVLLIGLGSVALASILLIAPAAFHRIAEAGDATPRFYRYASGMVQASLAPLAIALSADVYVVVAKVSHSGSKGATAGVVVLVTMIALWWGVPWIVRSTD